MGNAIHHGHLILWQLALQTEDVEKAKLHLLKAGETPGPPQLNSFGPDMTLAKQLLERGESQVVLEYFDLCGQFWATDRGKLDEWRKTVKAGRTPDFGRYLNR